MRMKPCLPVVAISLALLTLPVHAATIHVPDDQPTIQAGIDAASYGDTVLVACGTYCEHSIWMKSGICLRGETGQPECVTIDAQGAAEVIRCVSVDSTASVVGLTITGGSDSGIHCNHSHLRIKNVVLVGNSSMDYGGGMLCSNSHPTLVDVVFSDNNAGSSSPYGGDGGGLYCVGASSPVLTRVSFQGNSAVGVSYWGGCGGGMYCAPSSSPVLVDVTFSENQARIGGGLHCRTSSPTLTRVAFTSNVAAQNGGGMSCVTSSNPTLTDVSFIENTAGEDFGGGLMCWDYSYPALTRVTFCGNTARFGGGMYISDGSATLSHVTFSENAATEAGSAVCCWYSATVYAHSSIMAFGRWSEAIYCTDPGSTSVLSCCDVYGNAGGDWVGCIADQYGVNGNISEDPLFCLEDNPEEPYSLHEGSPCLPENSPCGELVGAFGEGCGPISPVGNTSWGVIKAMFR